MAGVVGTAVPAGPLGGGHTRTRHAQTLGHGPAWEGLSELLSRLWDHEDSWGPGEPSALCV